MTEQMFDGFEEMLLTKTRNKSTSEKKAIEDFSANENQSTSAKENQSTWNANRN